MIDRMHNGGPAIEHPDTIELRKIRQWRKHLRDVWRRDIDLIDKGVMTGIMLEATESAEGVVAKTRELMIYTGAKKQHTIGASLNRLIDDHKMLRRQNRMVDGARNVYDVLALGAIEEYLAIGSGWIATPELDQELATNRRARRPVATQTVRSAKPITVVPLNGIAPIDTGFLSDGCRSTAAMPLNGISSMNTGVLSGMPLNGSNAVERHQLNEYGPDDGCRSTALLPLNGIGTDIAPHARASRFFEEGKEGRKEERKKESTASQHHHTVTASATPVARVAGGGEDAQGNLRVSGDKIAHKDFVISPEAIRMQLNGTVSVEICRTVALGFAQQWAAEIEAKGPAANVPKYPVNYIRDHIARAKAAGTGPFSVTGDSSDCRWSGDLLVVQEPLRAELLAIAGGSVTRLQTLLAKAAGSIQLGVTGLALRKAVRAGVLRNAEWDSRDERKAKAVEIRVGGASAAAPHRVAPGTIRHAKPAPDSNRMAWFDPALPDPKAAK